MTECKVSAEGPSNGREQIIESIGEDHLKSICSEVLGRPLRRVKMEKSFVAQGGDSLLAIKLMARCGEEGYCVSIHDILQESSIGRLVKCVKPERSGRSTPSTPSSPSTTGTVETDRTRESAEVKLDNDTVNQLRRITVDPTSDVRDIFCCSPIQEMFLVAQAVYPHMYQCTFTVRIDSSRMNTPLENSRLKIAWDRLVERHAALRTVFVNSVSRPGHFDQVILNKATVPLHFVERDQPKAQALSMRRSFGFNESQFIQRATIGKLSPYSAILRLDISHAVIDGMSEQIILRDFCDAYDCRNFEDGVMPYQNFVSFQKNLDFQMSSDYWSQYLAGTAPSNFPTRSDKDTWQNFGTMNWRIELEAGMLERTCGKYNVTAANICQVSWALVLGAYTESDDICFSYVNSGREAPLKGIDNTVGPFVNTVISRLRIPRKMTISEALARAKNDYLKSLEHQWMERGMSSGDFNRLKGNTLMSIQREIVVGRDDSDLAFTLLDAASPTEVNL